MFLFDYQCIVKNLKHNFIIFEYADNIQQFFPMCSETTGLINIYLICDDLQTYFTICCFDHTFVILGSKEQM